VNPTTVPSIRRRRIALAALATLSLVAAACGDDDSAAPAATAAPATTPDTTDTMSDSMSDSMSDEMSSEMSEEMSEEMSGEMTAGMPFGPACSAVPADGEGSFGGMADDPAATAASNNPVLSTLVTAVTQAGLVDTLNGDGPFTIFAPTNDAFAAIPPTDLDAVLADQDLLTSILTYHVVAGESLSSTDLIAAGSVDTVNGGSLEITDVDGTLTVNGVPTVCMDVPTANATVHIIGGVLMPS
jgi:transforming growth factor-beta-induced protein